MTPTEAIAIIREIGVGPSDYILPTAHRILNGMNLLRDLSIRPLSTVVFSIEVGHDIIFCCGFAESVPVMTESEIRQMAQWGWHEHDDSWGHFT